jgi:hypothetical protein
MVIPYKLVMADYFEKILIVMLRVDMFLYTFICCNKNML